MSMLVWLIVPCNDFCGFSSVAVNSVYSLQFSAYIFAVLLPYLNRLCCRSVQQMLSKMKSRYQTHKPVNKCNYWGPIFETEWSRGSNCVSVPNFVAIGPTVAEIWRFFDFSKMAVVRHLRFVTCVFGPPTEGIWWSLSLWKIWLESVL